MEAQIKHDLPFAEYCAIDAINQSSLKNLDRSPAHYKYMLDQEIDSEAKRVGRMAHEYALENVEPGSGLLFRPSGLTKKEDLTQWLYKLGADPSEVSGQKMPELRELRKDLEQNRDFANYNECQEAKRLGDALMATDEWCKFLGMYESQRELSIVAEDPATGLPLKARLDAYFPDLKMILDLKFIADGKAHPDAWGGRWGTCSKFGYHKQAYFYRHLAELAGLEVENVCFAVIEKSERAPIYWYSTSRSALAQGEWEVQENLETLKKCIETKEFPDTEKGRGEIFQAFDIN